MDLILCHQTVDFDALGAAVGLSRLRPGSRIVLAGGAHPTVRDFLALHRDELALMEMRSVNPHHLRSLFIVDNQRRDRLGKAAQWLDLAHLASIEVYDHHLHQSGDIPATFTQIEAVGATTTLIVEKLQATELQLQPVEASVMALGIHVDTGSLTFPQTTVRDAKALAWLMEQGAQVRTIAEYVEPGLSPILQTLLTEAMENLESSMVSGFRITSVLLHTDTFIPGLSNLAEKLLELTESDALLLGHGYRQRQDEGFYPDERLTVIGRTRIEGTNLQSLFVTMGGGGHSQAASVNLRDVEPESCLAQLRSQLISQIPQPLTARDLMSSPVRTIRPQTTIEQAQRILFRYGHSGLSVVDRPEPLADQVQKPNQERGEAGQIDRLVGIISRRDIDLALHHGFRHAPVKGYMTRQVKTISPDTLLPDIEAMMVTFDLGRLPVVDQGKLIGIVTRTDVLRQLHRDRQFLHRQQSKNPLVSCLLPDFRDRLHPALWQFLEQAAQIAQAQGWHLYLVGGAIRDLLLTGQGETMLLQDIDLVVDGFHEAAEAEAGVQLARHLQNCYPKTRLSVHGEFQTAALLWHKDPELGSLWVDIATARTEFYPYPAANPQVEASSIRQDLYRRDFTINALALRLTMPNQGELLDFFGGILDLRSRQVRVLHANSFIEDPTRIYRAVRFAVRLGFAIEPQTESYIRYAVESGIYETLKLADHPAPALTTRLKAELKIILDSVFWQAALQKLSDLGALKCLHPHLQFNAPLAWQMRWITRLENEPRKSRLSNFQTTALPEPWLVRLLILLASLPERDRGKIATNLQLPQPLIDILQNLAEAEKCLIETLPLCQRASEIAKRLRAYKPITLILVAVRNNKAIRRQIVWYITQLSQMQPLLNGDDLKALGYRPGPQFKILLEALLMATLDQEITNQAEAKAWLKEFYQN